MDAGLELCRNGGCTAPATTFGHLTPRADKGHFSMYNITLLCKRCNSWQGRRKWHWLKPLSKEFSYVGLQRFVAQEVTRLDVYTSVQSCTVGGVSDAPTLGELK